MTDFLFNHYGIDWGAMVFMFLSIYHLGNKKRIGFLYGIVASLLWIAFNCLVNSLPGIVANAVIIFVNLQSYYKSPIHLFSLFVVK